MIKPVGLTHGHYECRSASRIRFRFLTNLLAFEMVGEADGNADHEASQYRLAAGRARGRAERAGQAALESLRRPRGHQPRKWTTPGNISCPNRASLAWWKSINCKTAIWPIRFISSSRAATLGKSNPTKWRSKSAWARMSASPGKLPWLPSAFPGRGFIPQALTHGTITCLDLEASRHFYTEVLGLDVVSPSRSVKPHYIKHPSTPWYVVSLEKPAAERKLLTPLQRYTITVESARSVPRRIGWLKESGASLGVTELGELDESDGALAFILSDPDRNWWEVTSPVSLN